MSAVFVSCDLLEEDTPELADLRQLVLEYDELFEMCMSKALTLDEQKTLDEMHECLSLLEQERWFGSSDIIVEMISGHSDIDFPMIRHELGMLPTKNHKGETK